MVFKWFSLIWRSYSPTGEEVSQCWETYICTGRHSGRQGFFRTNLGSFYEYLTVNAQRKNVEMQALTVGLHSLITWLDCPLVDRFLSSQQLFTVEPTTSSIRADYLKALLRSSNSLP